MRRRRQDAGERHQSARRVYEQLRSGIRSGQVGREDNLHEELLTSALGASRNSIRRALQMLAAQGLVTRQTRLGTRPAVTMLEFPAQHSSTAEESIRLVAVVRTVGWEQMSPDDPTMPAEMGDVLPVFRIEQVGSDHESELLARIVYVAGPVAVQGAGQDAAPACCDVNSFESVFGEPLADQRSLLSVESADATVGRALNIATGMPVLIRRRHLIDGAGRVRELGVTMFRADRVALSSRTSAVDRVSGGAINT